MGFIVQVVVLASALIAVTLSDQHAPALPIPGIAPIPRHPKSLTAQSKFPFDHDQHHDHHDTHDHHAAHAAHAAQTAPLTAHLGRNTPIAGNQFQQRLVLGQQNLGFRQVASNEDPDDLADGEQEERCVEKVMMIESTEFDSVLECSHSYDELCHTTYTTDFVPSQEEVCDESFEKRCFIEYRTQAMPSSVQICKPKQIKDCESDAPVVCETHYRKECENTHHEHEMEQDESVCETVQVEMCKDVTVGYTTKEECANWPQQKCKIITSVVKTTTPETICSNVPYDVCGPGPCPVVDGPIECHTKTRTMTREVPEETCTLLPIEQCHHETKMIPKLTPKETCQKVPKEICEYSKRSPRKVKKPVIKKWCFKPNGEGYPDFLDDDSTTTTTTEAAPAEDGQ